MLDGTAVGVAEGAGTVGLRVGAWVGEVVGAVGLRDGAAEGAVLGASVHASQRPGHVNDTCGVQPKTLTAVSQPLASGPLEQDGVGVGLNVVGADGASVGVAVGNVVGSAVGNAVGRIEGDPVGTWLGRAVGAVVGNNVGANVGLEEGRAVGSPVGDREGATVGVAVGASVHALQWPGQISVVVSVHPKNPTATPQPSGSGPVLQLGLDVGLKVGAVGVAKVGVLVGL